MFLNKLTLEQEDGARDIQMDRSMLNMSKKMSKYKMLGGLEEEEEEDEGFVTEELHTPLHRPVKDQGHSIVYNVQKGDTMQGIAIKFGITMEQIRRTNRMWASDNLFLRDKLIIPVQSTESWNRSSLSSNNSFPSSPTSSASSGSESDTEVDPGPSGLNSNPLSTDHPLEIFRPQEETTAV